jgi:hypothetical protein
MKITKANLNTPFNSQHPIDVDLEDQLPPKELA